ncbi:acyl-ACP--UDP-N-acetylglucosamine O-acyltransferase [Synechococcales cyanobacterium C]|uniref:Acyl-ACP--UDP-N-acetylglucosamine O-acyltransferase n=1 Tax=Petrachloros mirabilis ULC683 TaxID=2781853 RepID=A0A8K2A0M4_9CYAN|nr:acyl-ACP--UDP-N-acetylglucosamine O-acyltransferase [Petrachloros mirabilis ULC683]
MAKTVQIHPTAVIHPGAVLAESVVVAPYAIIGEQVIIGERTHVGAYVVIEGHTELGADNQIFPGATIGLAPQDRRYQGEPSGVSIGDRNQIREHVTIHRAVARGGLTRIGSDNVLMTQVHIAHDCCLQDQVVIASGTGLAGGVQVASQVVIGGLAGIHQGVQIGRLSMVGAQSAIRHDVPPFMLVAGHPARVRVLNQVGLRRAGTDSESLQALKQVFRLLYRSGQPFAETLSQLSQGSDPLVQELHQFLERSKQAGRRGLTPGRLLTVPSPR